MEAALFQHLRPETKGQVIEAHQFFPGFILCSSIVIKNHKITRYFKAFQAECEPCQQHKRNF